MISNSQSPEISELDFENENNFTLGIRELLFLATILFIGFCGFSVCVDKIYSVSESNIEIESITVHDKDLSVNTKTQSTSESYSGYSISIEN